MRLIDADALKKSVLDLPNCYNGFSDTYDKSYIIGVIDEQPTAEKRKKGKWIEDKLDICKCEQCGYRVRDWFVNQLLYCPHCGAEMIMRGEENG